MAIEQTFSVISLDALLQEAGRRNGDGWRYIQTLAVNTDAGIDLVYSFMKDGRIDNLKIVGVQKGDVVPSITGMFLAAFVFENEIRELFGVNVVDIAIDFNGSFYDLTAPEPMTIVSPEQKAAKEKAAKVRAAMAAKAAKAAKEAAAAAAGEKPAGASEGAAAADAELEAKLAAMDPAKAAKVRAAMAAKAAKAAKEAAAAAAQAADQEGGAR